MEAGIASPIIINASMSSLLHIIHQKLEEYVEKIQICGTSRNSYSKTDTDATFMRIKSDYMGK